MEREHYDEFGKRRGNGDEGQFSAKLAGNGWWLVFPTRLTPNERYNLVEEHNYICICQ